MSIIFSPFVQNSDLWDLMDSPSRLVSSAFGLTPMQRELFQAGSLVDSLARQLNRMERKYQRDLASVHDRNDRFEVALDCSHFKPEEIKVKLSGNDLIVDAKHEERSDEHGFISRQFTRRYLLPENLILDKMESSLGPDGVLSIRAPKKIEHAVDSSEKNIPIQLTSETYKPSVAPKEDKSMDMSEKSMSE